MAKSALYLANKASEIEWIGEIPKHWSVKPLFALFRERRVVNEGNQETNVLSLSYGQIIRRDIESNFGLLPESFETYNIIEPQNIVLRLTDLQNDKRSLRCGLAKERGIITSAYLTLESKAGVDCQYMFYLLHSYDILKVFYSMGGGVRQSIKFGDLKRIPVLEPPLEEQRIISDALNKKMERINELIAQKEKMIELLKEERAAVINHAVTGGLDPKVELKNTGIEWLGRIPRHWTVKRLKRIVRLINDAVAVEPSDLVVDLENIESWSGRLIGNELLITPDEMKRFERGDVLFNKLRPYLAKVFMAPRNGVCGGELLVLRPHRGMNPRFLFYRCVSEAFINVIDGSTYGTKMPRASWDFIGNVLIPYPENAEQEAIANYLDKKTNQIDEQINRAERSIQLLKEYRTALISEAATGKIDLRDMAHAN